MINFAIIGAQKAASTYVHRALEAHPDIYLPENEVRAFEDPEYALGGVSEISKEMQSRLETVKGVKRPDYLAKHEVPQRLLNYNPQIKLILILRNPVERFYSAYFHLVKLGFLPVEDPNEAIAKILAGQYKSEYKKSVELLDYGLYYQHLQRWLAFFPQDRFRILFDRELRNNAANCVQSLYQWLGVREFDFAGVKQSKSNPGVYSLKRLRFINLRNKLVFSYNEDKTRLQRKAGVAPIVNNLIMGVDRYILGHLCSNKKYDLDESHVTYLQEYYKQDAMLLGKYCDTDLSAWYG